VETKRDERANRPEDWEFSRHPQNLKKSAKRKKRAIAVSLPTHTFFLISCLLALSRNG
jgi:hypothetical protein